MIQPRKDNLKLTDWINGNKALIVERRRDPVRTMDRVAAWTTDWDKARDKIL